MAWVCNDCAEKNPDTYPSDCKLARAGEGKARLCCEECGAMVTVLNKPYIFDDLVDDWEDIRMSVDSRSRIRR